MVTVTSIVQIQGLRTILALIDINDRGNSNIIGLTTTRTRKTYGFAANVRDVNEWSVDKLPL